MSQSNYLCIKIHHLGGGWVQVLLAVSSQFWLCVCVHSTNRPVKMCTCVHVGGVSLIPIISEVVLVKEGCPLAHRALSLGLCSTQMLHLLNEWTNGVNELITYWEACSALSVLAVVSHHYSMCCSQQVRIAILQNLLWQNSKTNLPHSILESGLAC